MASRPDVFEEAHRILFASKRYLNTNLSYLHNNGHIIEYLFGLGKTRMIKDWSRKFPVKGYHPIMTIIENRTPGDTPGKFGEKIKVLVDVDLSETGKRWSPLSDKSQVITVIEKSKETHGFLYVLQTSTEDPGHYINPEYLKPGSKWIGLSEPRGEAFEHLLTGFRQSCRVTEDDIAEGVLYIEFQDEKDKINYWSWMDMREAEHHMAMNKEMATYAMYSRLRCEPSTPYEPRTAGLQQQISFGGNIIEHYNDDTYNDDTLKPELIETFFKRIVYSRISPRDLGEVIGFSGLLGMRNFKKALDVWSDGKPTIIEESSTARSGNDNSLRPSCVYNLLYNLPSGGRFRLFYNPLYDDESINRETDRLGNLVDAQRITILDVTDRNNKSISGQEQGNVRLVRKEKVFGTTIVEGRCKPGGDRSEHPRHGGGYYEVSTSDSIGIQVKDLTLTGELIKKSE